MGFRVEYSARALKQLKKMSRFDAAIITSWIGNHLEGADDPRRWGKPLKGDHSGEWRYRVGNYRVLCVLHDDVLLVEVVAIGHRQGVYKHK